ncbi:MAG: YcgL domain-containing protein, partial [Pseudomonadota bacterium]|nr:YcgL domain-containing protein [Pseudomonadota bacterium]
MLCAVYKTRKKDGMYLYVPKKDHFEDVPEPLMA